MLDQFDQNSAILPVRWPQEGPSFQRLPGMVTDSASRSLPTSRSDLGLLVSDGLVAKQIGDQPVYPDFDLVPDWPDLFNSLPGGIR